MKIQRLLTLVATAAFITSASASISMDWVNVGNPGFGAVAYAYQIGKHEVTNSQYGAFLNAKGASNSGAIYNTNMASYGITQSGVSGNYSYSVTGALANRPVVYVSWFDAARFANWMMNGQGSGDMETGAYTLNGATSGIINANIGAQVYLPTGDEWYKAAYYNAATTSYDPKLRQAYYNAATESYETTSAPTYYGTFNQSGDIVALGSDFWGEDLDQAADVREWSDAVRREWSPSLREVWGSFMSIEDVKESNFGPASLSSDPAFEDKGLGFRLASVPEPTSIFLTMFAGGMMLIRRKR